MGEVRDNLERQRYELDVPQNAVAFLDYRRQGNVVQLVHAEVPAALQGRGFGSQLVRGVLEQVRRQGGKVVPRCPFVAAYLQRHPEFRDLVAQ